jgi:signal peptidase I
VTMLPTPVPAGHVFVLGDNRAPLGSRDSRAFGAVPEASVGGRASWVVWPPLRRAERGDLAWNVRPVSAP